MDAEPQTESAAVPSADVSRDGTTASFYIHKDEVTYGPESVDNVRQLWEAGWLQAGDLVWQEGTPEWLAAGTVFTPALTTGMPDPERPGALPREPAEDAFFQPAAVRLSAEQTWPLGSLGIAIAAHAFLLVLVIELLEWFPINFDPYTSPPVAQPPPLEVAMVAEPEPAPPPPPPPPPDPTPPPPDLTPPTVPPLATPDLPPPPPAPAEMPIPSDPLPPLPTEPLLPEEMATTPTVPKPAVHLHKMAKASVTPPMPVAAQETPPADAGAPEYLADPRPVYPYAAKMRHQEGTVLLLVTLDEAGNPISVSVEQSSGSSLLDDAARKKVAADWRFKPGQGSQVHVPVEFHLEEAN